MELKAKRRQDNGQEFYRSGKSTLISRYKKKLTAKTSWYKKGDKENKKRKYEMDEEETEEMRKRYQEKRAKKPPERKNKTKAVLFVPYTHGSVLAKRLREAEESMLETTGYKLKIVERGGSKLEDLLHRSDPSQGQDCERQGCLLCSTKLKTGKNTSQCCSKRNLVYKTYCITFRDRED